MSEEPDEFANGKWYCAECKDWCEVNTETFRGACGHDQVMFMPTLVIVGQSNLDGPWSEEQIAAAYGEQALGKGACGESAKERISEELKRLSDAATPGPWEHDGRGAIRCPDGFKDGTETADAEFNVALVNAYRAGDLVPRAEVARLRKALEAIDACSLPAVLEDLGMSRVDYLRRRHTELRNIARNALKPKETP